MLVLTAILPVDAQGQTSGADIVKDALKGVQEDQAIRERRQRETPVSGDQHRGRHDRRRDLEDPRVAILGADAREHEQSGPDGQEDGGLAAPRRDPTQLSQSVTMRSDLVLAQSAALTLSGTGQM